MATGIVAIAAQLLGLTWAAKILLVLSPFLYVTLWVCFILRAVRYPVAFRSDRTKPGQGVGYFTIVAGTAVLGAQLMIQINALQIAAGLWLFALLLYVIVVYGLFTAFTIRTNKPDLRHALNGTWLVLIVATQGVAVLGGNVVTYLTGHEQLVSFSTLAFG